MPLPPTQTPSAVWADARDAPLTALPQRLLIQEEDAASVASDASTVVPEHPSADDLAAVEQQLQAQHAAAAAADELAAGPPRRWSLRSEQAAEPAELPDAGEGGDRVEPERAWIWPAALPCLQLSIAPARLRRTAKHPVPAAPPSSIAAAAPFHPIHGAVLEQVPFAAAPMRRSSLSPAVSAGNRRSSFGVAVAVAPPAPPPAGVAPVPSPPAQQAPEPSLRLSLGSGEALVAEAPTAMASLAPAAEEPAQQVQPQVQEAQANSGAPPAELAPVVSAFALAPPEPSPAPLAADDATRAPAGEASGASACSGGAPGAAAAGGLAPAPEGSRLSLASSSGGVAPSLRVEYSEASLRYSGAPAGAGAARVAGGCIAPAYLRQPPAWSGRLVRSAAFQASAPAFLTRTLATPPALSCCSGPASCALACTLPPLQPIP